MLISAERVLLGPAGEHLDDGAVLVDGTRIAAVGPRAALEEEHGAARVHGTTLLPGVDDQRHEVADAMAAAGIVACSGSSGNWRAFAERVGIERARTIFGRMRWMADRAVSVIVGTDAGLVPFDGFPATLVSWGEWGFEPAEVLEIATSRAADVLGLGDVTGRLAPGLDADLLLVDGRPDDDLADLASISLVVARGRPHRRGAP